MSEAIRTVQANDLRFAYLEQGSGPLALCLHGFPDTPHTWRDLLPALAKAGYRAVAPFLRGYPPTEAPVDGDYSGLRLGEDVVSLIEALGEKRAVVIGHDWGAFSAYAAASLAPDKVEKLVTVAIPHPRALAPNLTAARKSWHFLYFQLRGRALCGTRADNFALIDRLYAQWSPDWAPPPEDVARVKKMLAEPGALEAVLGYYWSFPKDAFFPSGAGARAVLQKKTTVPTLCLAGRRDGAADLRAFDKTPACYEGAYKLVWFEDAGHFLHRERPERFRDEVLGFLKG